MTREQETFKRIRELLTKEELLAAAARADGYPRRFGGSYGAVPIDTRPSGYRGVGVWHLVSGQVSLEYG